MTSHTGIFEKGGYCLCLSPSLSWPLPEPEAEGQSLGYTWSLMSLYVAFFLQSCPIVIEVTRKEPFLDTGGCLSCPDG